MLILNKTRVSNNGIRVYTNNTCLPKAQASDGPKNRQIHAALAVSTAAPRACSSDLLFVSWSQSEKGRIKRGGAMAHFREGNK